MKEYRFHHLLLAYLEYLRYRDALPELRDYHVAKYQALSQLFKVNLEKPKKRETAELYDLFRDTIRVYRAASTPFDNYLEAPRSYVAVYQKHGPRLYELKALQQVALLEMMEDLATQMWGTNKKVFTSDDLRAKGVDDSNPPDPMDFW